MNSRKIAILHPGEMGAAIAGALFDAGHVTLTYLSGRSAKTSARAGSRSIRVAPTMRQLVEESQIIVSVVPPAAAEQVAQSVLAARDASARGDLIFVDVNSIRPEVARSLAKRCESAGVDFVDAAIHGQAGKLASGAALYLSGRRADEIARIFCAFMRVRVLGGQAGSASEMKMLLGGLSKGMCGLFLEIASLAQRCGALQAVLEEMRQFYPELMTPIARMLPTYLDHASRRAQEMRELNAMAIAAKQQCQIIPGLSKVFEKLAAVADSTDAPSERGIESIMQFFVSNGFLESARPIAGGEVREVVEIEL